MNRRMLLTLIVIGAAVGLLMVFTAGTRVARREFEAAGFDLVIAALNGWNVALFSRRLRRRPVSAIAAHIPAGPHRSALATVCPMCGQPVAPTEVDRG